jgi:hypothetical protein
MKTIRIKIYKFEELNKDAQNVSIENYRNNNLDHNFIYSDAYETVKQFNDLFGTTECRDSWLYFRTNNIDDSILELTGLRLQKYIYNNFGFKLFKPAFIGSLKSNELKNHYRIRSKKLSNGNVFNPYYSAIKKETCCVLTGVCYDDDILQPIYDFLNLRTFDSTNFAKLLNECFYSLKKSIENEIHYRNSDESIIEEIECNDFDFLKDGTQY